MKKHIVFVFAFVFILCMAGCQKTVDASAVYGFPEPTMQIKVTFCSQGIEQMYVIGSEEYDPDDLSTLPVISWFYDLQLTACDEPETVDGAESYIFKVKGEDAFIYEDRCVHIITQH